MLANFDTWFPRDHFDLVLKRALMSNEECRRELAAAFIYPSSDHFEEHLYMNMPGVRESSWDKRYVQEGTRPPAAPSSPPTATWKDWEIRQFEATGENPLLGTIVIPDGDDQLQWWTAAITVNEYLYVQYKVPRPDDEFYELAFRRAHSPDRDKCFLDKDDTFGLIQVSSYQIKDREEKKVHTQAAERRWRSAYSNFQRRSFTNNPDLASALVMSLQPMQTFQHIFFNLDTCKFHFGTLHLSGMFV